MNKIIFLDVDGTLVNYENHIPESAVKAIRKARKNGHKVYICTGRSKAEVYPELWEIGLDGMIGGNGSYVEHAGEIVFHKTFSKEQCTEIVDWLMKKGLEFYLESNEGLFASRNFETAAGPVMQEYARRKANPDAEQITVRKAFPDMIFGGGLYRRDVNKISYILNSYQDYEEACKVFVNLQNGTWGGRGETALFGDIGLKNINKSSAILALLEYLGASMEDTIAFGDAKVDIPMLSCCATGVAMGNGGEEIKEMADLITDVVDEDGLWNAFCKLGLI